MGGYASPSAVLLNAYRKSGTRDPGSVGGTQDPSGETWDPGPLDGT